MYRLLLVLALAVPLAACDSDDDDARATSTAQLAAPPDTTTGVAGQVQLFQDGEGLEMTVTVNGLAPNSVHGFHIHEVGDCGRGDHDGDGFAEVAGAARGHFDPLNTNNHGAPDDPRDRKHAGDFGNVTADGNGRAQATVSTELLSLNGQRAVQGRTVMVHSNRDDLTTDPGGTSGDRIACGVIPQATISVVD